jgi:drug/metabolite transporter (DMT)-like permease
LNEIAAGGGVTAPLSRNLVGAGWMLASAVTFVLMMTLVKFLGATYSTPLETFFRQLAMFIVLLPVIVKNGPEAFAATRPGILIGRSILTVLAMVLSFYSYNKLTLVTANTLSFTRSLWLVPLAVITLRERMGTARVGAVCVGFLGVLAMLRTNGAGLLDPAALSGLAAAAMFAVTVTGMKALTRDHTITSIVCWSAALGVVLAFPLALFSWRWPTLRDAGLIGVMGLLAVLNQTCYARGMQAGDALVMAPIDYTRLIFSTALGVLLFHERVELAAYAGAFLIVASSAWVTWHEHVTVNRLKAEGALAPDKLAPEGAPTEALPPQPGSYDDH